MFAVDGATASSCQNRYCSKRHCGISPYLVAGEAYRDLLHFGSGIGECIHEPCRHEHLAAAAVVVVVDGIPDDQHLMGRTKRANGPTCDALRVPQLPSLEGNRG
jgi:hypothetical protein